MLLCMIAKLWERKNKLKGIPNIVSPDLLKVLHVMGHGNYPDVLMAKAGDGGRQTIFFGVDGYSIMS